MPIAVDGASSRTRIGNSRRSRSTTRDPTGGTPIWAIGIPIPMPGRLFLAGRTKPAWRRSSRPRKRERPFRSWCWSAALREAGAFTRRYAVWSGDTACSRWSRQPTPQ